MQSNSTLNIVHAATGLMSKVKGLLKLKIKLKCGKMPNEYRKSKEFPIGIYVNFA